MALHYSSCLWTSALSRLSRKTFPLKTPLRSGGSGTGLKSFPILQKKFVKSKFDVKKGIFWGAIFPT